jgi:rubrerythrin
MELDEQLRQQLSIFQRNEITEHHIYTDLAGTVSPENRQVLEQIAADELRHYREWSKYTRKEIAPDKLKVRMYYWISRVLGLSWPR